MLGPLCLLSPSVPAVAGRQSVIVRAAAYASDSGENLHCFLVAANKSYVTATSDLWLFIHASNLLPLLPPLPPPPYIYIRTHTNTHTHSTPLPPPPHLLRVNGMLMFGWLVSVFIFPLRSIQTTATDSERWAVCLCNCLYTRRIVPCITYSLFFQVQRSVLQRTVQIIYPSLLYPSTLRSSTLVRKGFVFLPSRGMSSTAAKN